MRNMSFALTTEQVLNRTKTVTRRLGWENLQPGTLVRAVRKGMGLKKGEKIEPLAVLRIVNVRREPIDAILDKYDRDEVRREGFDMSPLHFLTFFMEAHGRTQRSNGKLKQGTQTIITRIEFEYV